MHQYFEALPQEHGLVHNHGVYLCGGIARGVFTRVHPPPSPGTGGTDARARCAAVLVEPRRAWHRGATAAHGPGPAR